MPSYIGLNESEVNLVGMPTVSLPQNEAKQSSNLVPYLAVAGDSVSEIGFAGTNPSGASSRTPILAVYTATLQGAIWEAADKVPGTEFSFAMPPGTNNPVDVYSQAITPVPLVAGTNYVVVAVCGGVFGTLNYFAGDANAQIVGNAPKDNTVTAALPATITINATNNGVNLVQWATVDNSGVTTAKIVTGGVADVTAVTPQTTASFYNVGGNPTAIIPVVPPGGLSSSIIGVCPNESQGPAQRVFSADQTVDHVAAVIGADDPVNAVNVTEIDVNKYDAETETMANALQYETATSPVASGGAFPNTYLNETDPEVTVDTGDATFSVEP